MRQSTLDEGTHAGCTARLAWDSRLAPKPRASTVYHLAPSGLTRRALDALRREAGYSENRLSCWSGVEETPFPERVKPPSRPSV
jgi:hypothetical protein